MPVQPKITQIIPAQNFESVLDRIVAVLTLELNNQATLDEDFTAPLVYKERETGIDAETEMAAITVKFFSGVWDNKSYDRADGNPYTYHIKIWTSALSTDTEEGFTVASIALNKLVGMVRYILDNPAYSALDFAQNVKRVWMTEVSTSKEDSRNNGAAVCTANILFSVVCTESSPLDGTYNALEENWTLLKWENNENGFYLKFTNE